MSSASNSVTEIKENTGNMPMNAIAYRSDELRAREEDREELPFVETIVGRRGSLRDILSLVEAVAPTKRDSSDCGAKPGTGKEVIARAIHECSPRRHQSLVKVNCPAIPAGLLEKRTLRARARSLYGRYQLSCRPVRVGGSRNSVPR